MTAHAPEPANDRMARLLNAALTGRWHVWYIPMIGQRKSSWQARPDGVETSTLTAWGADDLARKIAGTDHESGMLLRGLIPELAAEYT